MPDAQIKNIASNTDFKAGGTANGEYSLTLIPTADIEILLINTSNSKSSSLLTGLKVETTNPKTFSAVIPADTPKTKHNIEVFFNKVKTQIIINVNIIS